MTHFALALLALASSLSAAVSVSHFGDHMVLQRGKPVPVWGTATPGETVSIHYRDQMERTSAGPEGRWKVMLKPMAAGDPSELTLKAGNVLVLRDVVVGEVWLAGGQSNMAMSLKISDSDGTVIPTADHPLLRFNNARDPRGWSVCSPANAGGLSAVAFHFGRELQKKLGVPVGLVVRAVGGTRIEQWMDPGAASAEPDLVRDTLFAGLYRQHIAPLMPMAIRGALWYQGESNEQTPETYRRRLPALIRGWRKAWGQGDFAFYLVQLPLKNRLQATPQGDGPWPEIREIQRLALSLPNTGLAVALDVGNPVNVHPLNKQPVGYRLSLIARALEYGEGGPGGLVHSGPLYESMTLRGSRVHLRFRHAGGGLVARGGGPPKGFALCGADGRWVWADARIQGDTVVVSSPEVPSPVRVRYAWSQHPVFNLYNAEGLPASPFRTDGDQLPTAMAIPSRRPSAGPARARASLDALGRRGPVRIPARSILRREYP